MKTCTQCKAQFQITDSDRAFYRKIDVPGPTLCPGCRYQRRLTWRSELNFYSNKCGLCGTDVLSTLGPHSGYTVYCRPCYWSDKWNPLSYGRDFDFSRPFFEQFSELVKATPTVHLFGFADNENSVYVNYAGSLKNSYMYCGGRWGENMYYVFFGVRNKDSVDVAIAYDSELCYDSTDINNCYNVRYSEYCRDCNESAFLYNCNNCQNCFCSTNLSNASFVFCNQKLTKEQYTERMKEVHLSTYMGVEHWRKEFEKLKRVSIRKPVFSVRSENCTGDYFRNSKDCIASYSINDCENAHYCQFVSNMRDVMDISQAGFNGELAYEICTGGNASYNLGVGVVVRDCMNVWYSYICHNSNNLFGCANLWKQEYCIFNKKYASEEYEKLRMRIIAHMKETGEWGQFFPTQFSPYSYNESAAQDSFSMIKDEALSRGWRWQDKMPETRGKETVSWDKVPDDIIEVSESICKEILACAETGKNYKIIKQEFDFYKRMGIPIPRLHPDVRKLKRLALRNPRKLWHRQCVCSLAGHGQHAGGVQCITEFETTYPPDSPAIVYCEQCYQAEVV